MNRSPLIALLPLALSVGACAASGTYPSLARRSFEVAPADAPPAPPAPVPVDASLQARIDAALTKARGGVPAFEAALAKARADAASASGAAKESESWILAELSLSRAEPSLEPATSALADLDGEKRKMMLAAANPSDTALLDAAIAELAALTEAQGDAVRALGAQLSR